MTNAVRDILVWAVPVMLAITVHEAAHGYVARHFGDPTAERAGRITLDPFRHIDPVGTILVPLCLFLTTGMAFGWAKPVPVNFNLLRNPKADMLWVAAAGPFANLVMAVVWAMIYSLIARKVPPLYMAMAVAGISVNGVLFLLNLLPIPPLDGGRIMISLLPNPLSRKYAQLEPYGLPILVVLMVFGILNAILGPMLAAFVQGLQMLFGL